MAFLVWHTGLMKVKYLMTDNATICGPSQLASTDGTVQGLQHDSKQ